MACRVDRRPQVVRGRRQPSFVNLPAGALATLPLEVTWPMRSTTVAIAAASVLAIGLASTNVLTSSPGPLLAGTRPP